MFLPLAFTHIIALMASLVLSILVIPAFCHFLLGRMPTRRASWSQGHTGPTCRSCAGRCGARPAVIAASLALLAGTILLIPRLGTEFMPIMDEGAFDMDVQFLPGISLSRSLELSRRVEARLMEFPELKTIVGKTGQTGIALEARGVEKTGYVGMLKPRSEWTTARSREELSDRMREAVEDIPGMAVSFSQPIACRIDELVAGTKAQLIIKLFGEDLDVLKEKAGEIAAVLGRIRGAKDVNVEVDQRPALPHHPRRPGAHRPPGPQCRGCPGRRGDGHRRQDGHHDLRGRQVLRPAAALPRGQAGFARGRGGHPRAHASRSLGAPGPGRRDRGDRGAQPDQPRERHAAHRRRVQYLRPRPGRLRRRGPPGDRRAA